MNIDKTEIRNNICYTELVYGRINKKLNRNLSKSEIEKILDDIISETKQEFFKRVGKNIYVTSTKDNIKITINSTTFRIITVDMIIEVFVG